MKTYYGLISAGGHGWEVMPMLRSMIQSGIANGNVELVFVVENLKEESLVSNHRLISLETFFALDGNKRFNVAIGDSRVRQRIADLCLAQGIKSFPVLARSATLLDNNKIGEGSVVGMGAVVIQDVEPYTTVVGNPARSMVK